MEVGYCKFCGQAYTVEAVPDAAKDELDELATMKCGCAGAAAYAYRQGVLATYDQDLEVVFAEGNEDFKELFRKAGQMIMAGKMKSLSIKTERDKAMSLKVKQSGLCITITEKKTMENISNA